MIARPSTRRLAALVSAIGLALGGAVAGPAPALSAADGILGIPTASARFGEGVTFEQPFFPLEPSTRVEVLISTPGAVGPLVAEVVPPECCREVTLRHALTEADGHLVPNTRFSARWRITSAGGRVTLGESVSITYADTRFAWRTKSGDIMRVHWYEGSSAFGERALAIGERAIANAAKLLGVTETEPVDFFIYAGQAEFYEALGPGTRENVGGEAHADIRTMFALITPDDIDASWVGVVVPHELTHLVFNTAVENPYHFPPRWLNEGLAVYLSEGYGDSWRAPVDDAVRSREIIPLNGLSGQFPTTRDRFFLAYAESISAVDFLVRIYGRPALVKLIRSYADGVSDDEAFRAALGSGSGLSGPDVAAFQAAWLEDLGAAAPTAYGPKPGPAGPLPSGWSASPGTPTATATATATAGADPSASPAPTGGTPSEDPAASDTSAILLLLLLGIVAVGGGILVARSRRRRGTGPG